MKELLEKAASVGLPTCLAAVQYVGMSALSIPIQVEDTSSAAITTAQVPAHSNLACGVTTTGDRKLRGSLLALGRSPIPWA